MLAAAVASGTASSPAEGADDKIPAEHPTKDKDSGGKPLEDATTKRATVEMATYTDTDNVTVFTPSISASVDNVTGGASLRGSYLVDIVSAASADIVSTASRRWVEARQAGSLEAEYKPHDFGVSAGGSVSSEPDYLAYGFGATVTHDFNEKNLTLLFGYGYGHDTIGRAGTPFSIFSRTVNRGSFSGGATVVIDRATVAAGVLDVGIENGDQSKPYRYIPMFSPDVAAGVPKGASIDWVNQHRLPERPLEQLPLSRRRFSLTGRIAHRFDFSTLRVEERLYNDTWGLDASTTDVRWIFDIGRRFAVWPHGRIHAQLPVNFWQRAYISGPAPGWDLPEFRTGDRELGPLWTATGGAGLKIFIGPASDPRTWGITVQGDVGHTAFLDDLYLTGRTNLLGSISLEGEL